MRREALRFSALRAKFVECEFVNCEFTKNNLNGDCSFNDVAWYSCKQINCVGLAGKFRNKGYCDQTRENNL